MFLETEVLWHDLEKWNYQAQPEIYSLKIQAFTAPGFVWDFSIFFLNDPFKIMLKLLSL